MAGPAGVQELAPGTAHRGMSGGGLAAQAVDEIEQVQRPPPHPAAGGIAPAEQHPGRAQQPQQQAERIRQNQHGQQHGDVGFGGLALGQCPGGAEAGQQTQPGQRQAGAAKTQQCPVQGVVEIQRRGEQAGPGEDARGQVRAGPDRPGLDPGITQGFARGFLGQSQGFGKQVGTEVGGQAGSVRGARHRFR